jgi:hypothetical protein
MGRIVEAQWWRYKQGYNDAWAYGHLMPQSKHPEYLSGFLAGRSALIRNDEALRRLVAEEELI